MPCSSISRKLELVAMCSSLHAGLAIASLLALSQAALSSGRGSDPSCLVEESIAELSPTPAVLLQRRQGIRDGEASSRQGASETVALEVRDHGNQLVGLDFMDSILWWKTGKTATTETTTESETEPVSDGQVESDARTISNEEEPNRTCTKCLEVKEVVYSLDCSEFCEADSSTPPLAKAPAPWPPKERNSTYHPKMCAACKEYKSQKPEMSCTEWCQGNTDLLVSADVGPGPRSNERR